MRRREGVASPCKERTWFQSPPSTPTPSPAPADLRAAACMHASSLSAAAAHRRGTAVGGPGKERAPLLPLPAHASKSAACSTQITQDIKHQATERSREPHTSAASRGCRRRQVASAAMAASHEGATAAL